MNSKTLRRILAKTLNIRSREELETLFASFSEKDGVLDLIDSLDKAIVELDRMIDIRDRSLAISSREMVTLNDQIAAQAREQGHILDQLRATVSLLRDDRGEMNSSTGLGELVGSVAELVRNQLSMAQDLKMYFEEGLQISAALSFFALEQQLQKSVSKIAGQNIGVKIYFAGILFGDNEVGVYHACEEGNAIGERLDAKTVSPGDFQIIHSTKGSGILAYVKIQGAAKLLSRVQPLLPSVASTLENIKLMQEERHKQRMETELQTARFVQQALIPPPQTAILDSRLEINGFYQSASECGGDWWLHLPMADGRNMIFIGDVTGHGTASAMICAVVRGYCESIRYRRDLSVTTMLEELNRLVYQISSSSSRAMTMAVLAFDRAGTSFAYANAGHPPPIFLSADGSMKYLLGSGHLLGLNESAQYKERNYPFAQGDRIVLYSDGLIEGTDHERRAYGDTGLMRSLKRATADLTAAKLNHSIINDFKKFAAGRSPDDDITTVVLKGL